MSLGESEHLLPAHGVARSTAGGAARAYIARPIGNGAPAAQAASRSKYSESVHALFAAQAEANPAAVALVDGGRSITYEELLTRSRALASELQAHGVGVETPVAILFERSWTAIVAMLGVLEAGGCYVPIDPSFPAARRSAVLHEADACHVIAQPKFAADFDGLNLTVWSLADDATLRCIHAASRDVESSNAADKLAPGERLCYVMYTSGSTGVPKGVAVPHRAVNRLVNQPNYLTFSRDDVFLQFAPLAFDASTLEIWGPLCNGGKLVIAPPQRPSLADLAALIQQQHVTTLWLTAGLFHQMVDHQLASLRGLKYLLAGGDVLSPRHVQTALDALAGVTLINGYGPTENTTFTACHVMKPGTKLSAESVPIGLPISGTDIVLLNEQLEPVGADTVAEICVGGSGLARGYHRRPELTAASFISDPRSEDPERLLYRTGDLGYWGPDGLLYFVGRVDQQVKVRGYRIELNEIERAITSHPQVAQAVVAVQEHQAGKRLVAYFIPRDATRPTGAIELREHVAQTLPDYMAPAVYMQLAEFPLTANGKVDRRQLPEPDGERPDVAADFAEPASALEVQLAAIWSEALGLETVGRADHFVELGGDSMLAVEIAQRANMLGLRIDPQQLFQYPTIEALAEVIAAGEPPR